MKFSICIIVKNEARTLPKLFSSLEKYKAAGGEVCILDTGSNDDTAKVAAAWGAKVFSGHFIQELHEDTCRKINQKFVASKEANIVEKGVKLFNFANARNYINSKATNDMICTLDADEAYTVFDFEKINALIDEGYEQFEYQFIYAHDQFGKPAVQFVQSKFFNRTKAHWAGIVHEVVTGATKIKYLDESIIRLEHFQEPGKEHRGGYLPGLALDCYDNPTKDRQSHYFARELMYSGRYNSAIKEFKRHLTLNGWQAERAQSMIYIGTCYGHLNDPDNQFDWFNRAFKLDSNRRAPLMELAYFMKFYDNKKAAAAYAAAALQLPWVDYYANDRHHYEAGPHEILYWAKGWMGDVAGAREHLLKALEYQPYNQLYLRDTKFYFDYPDNGIDGWMVFPELQWLYETAKKYKNIVEVGSWKGKSTHALLSGTKGTVTAVDTWQGSEDPRDHTNILAKQDDIYGIFEKNTSDFKNLKVVPQASPGAANYFDDKSIDFLFIDAGHTYEDVKKDLIAWMPKMKPDGLISGHDYMPDVWMGVIQAVNEAFGKPDGVAGLSIWYVDLSTRGLKLPWIEKGPGFDEALAENEKEFNRGLLKTLVIELGDAIAEKVKEMPDYDKKLDRKLIESVYPEFTLPKIPKIIWSCWLSEDPMPDNIKKCIDSQKIPGYEHFVINLKKADWIDSEYLRAAIKAKKWVKATDWIRMKYLLNLGGIFLDADVEILPGMAFNHLLSEQMFVGKEVNNPDGSIVLGTAVIGAQPGHPLIKKWIAEVEKNFKGDDDKNYESSMDLLNLLGVDFQDQMKILEPEVFYPFYWRTGETKQTAQTMAIHHFMRSWVPPAIPINKNTPDNWLTRMIETRENFTFVKRGDGEELCMGGAKGANCDGHPYSEELGRKLKEAFWYLESVDAYIVKFNRQESYNQLLHRTDNDPSEFWKAVKKSTATKIFVGPEKLIEAANFLGQDVFIEVPEIDAYSQYRYILHNTPKEKGAIYILCAGFISKLLIHDLREKYKTEATFIDAGSAWDPWVSETRTFQMSKEQMRALYGEKITITLPQNPKPGQEFTIKNEGLNEVSINQQKNFSLPQATHPERLWVIKHLSQIDMKVADLGCGTHKTIPEAIGVDIRPITDFQADLGEGLPFKTDYLDAVISRHSLEHVLNPVRALRNWIMCLKKNSKLLIVLPDHGSINTIDPVYSNGEHLHAYTMESFSDFISLFPELWIEKIEPVLERWSFGAVIHSYLPMVSIIIPQLGRPEGLERCQKSISELNYPKKKLEVIVIEGEETVPEKLRKGLKMAHGDVICYAANDMEFTPDAMIRAVEMSRRYGLVSFNAGPVLPDKGNICEHFIIGRDLIERIGGEIFDTRLVHCGVDNLLWAKAEKLSQAHWCEKAVIFHYHFSKGGKMDPVYEKGWSHRDEDRKKLAELIQTI